MQQKYHLLLAGVAVAALMLLMIRFAKTSEPVASPAPQETISGYAITIVRASWGLNCLALPSAPGTLSPGNLRPVEDNVLGKISNSCETKNECILPVNAGFLGIDPAPGCPSKELVVEYRCFSYDRLWTAKATSGTLSIKCTKPAS